MGLPAAVAVVAVAAAGKIQISYMNLKNKVIVITGASDGIGKQVTLAVARKGAQLALIARSNKKLLSVQKEINQINPKLIVRVYPVDLRQTTALTKVIKTIIQDFKVIDVLLNIAGIWQKLSSLEEVSEATVDEIIETNLTSLIHCTRLCLPILKTRNEAIIINIASKSGVLAQSGQTVYTASKYGVKGFTDVLKVDLKGTSVRVAGIYQSGTRTQTFAKAGDRFPIDKFTDPADLAQVIVFMLTLPKKIWLHEVQVEY